MTASAAAFTLEEQAADFGRPFMPEELTPLFHTPAWRELTVAERLRYNQLQALYFNEQILYFETALGHGILGALLRQPWPERLAEGLQRFQEEERRHSAMFRRLNLRCAPELYTDGDFHFVQIPAVWRSASKWAAHQPLLFPTFLWLMLLQEERSLFYSRAFLRQRDTLEPHFVQTHRLHLADEVGHVRWDEELLDELWQRAHPLRRKLNAKLFAWMLGEFFSTPKRAQLRVLDELARELPAVRPRLPEMRRQVLALAQDEAYRASLYSREIVPRTFARFDASPELRSLSLCGYHPRLEAVL
ncbi:MAG TPA: diiron oxygenase [Thermoanaerobaculia bacterium]|nr:diiron oxygenase [Thermoanaerobaculia bacterium]